MTAEIIIANGQGVALAADSAVTIGNQKIFNSAIKVFSLSKVKPVGIMIYGNASLQSVPWEIIIKSYRASLKRKGFNTVEEYAEDFLKYICSCNKFTNSVIEENWVYHSSTDYFRLLQHQFLMHLEQADTENEAESQDIFETLVTNIHQKISQEPFIEGADAELEAKCLNIYKELITEILNGTFEEFTISHKVSPLLHEIIIMLHTRSVFISNNNSGIVITGYGETDIYPNVVAYKVEGIIQNRLKYKKDTSKCFKVEYGNDCRIIPFAQGEMVDTFMTGINPAIETMVNEAFGALIDDLPTYLNDSRFTDSITDIEKLTEQLKSVAPDLHDKYTKPFKTHIRQEQVKPIVDMVGVLPKEELASMAETLVNLTAFKRRVSNSLETVGGPVDVAVISLGDGMVWVKRKQYFPKELNSHFFDNYLREMNDD